MKLKQMADVERPRERLISHGEKQLSNAELMAIVLQSGSKEESALQLGHRVLSLFEGGLSDLTDVTYEELCNIKGIGPAKACQILAALELGKRSVKAKRKILGEVTSPGKVASFFQSEMQHLNKEHFVILFLNTKNMITSYETISVGSLNASIVHPREVFNRAIKKSAASIILVHNHPSGNPQPSKEDLKVTKRLKEVGEVVGINILDHLILTDKSYYSFKEHQEI